MTINSAPNNSQTRVVTAKGYGGNFEIRLHQQPRGVTEDFKSVDQAIAVCPVEVSDEFNFGLTKRKAIYRLYANGDLASPVIDREHCTRCGECVKFDQNGSIRLDEQPTEIELKAGAIVVATGFQPYEPYHGEFGNGEFPEVITLPQSERLLSNHDPSQRDFKWNGRTVRSMAMIYCVLSRQTEGVHQPQADGKVNEYCSRVCCTATLAAANRIRERFPDTDIYDVYQDIRTYGRGHEDYYTARRKTV